MSDIIFEHRTEFVSKEKLEGALEESARLREQRDKAEATLGMVKALADGYDWLSDGRGPYAYDDGRYDDDVRQFVSQLLELLPGGNWLGMPEWEAKYRSTEAENARLREQAKLLVGAFDDLTHGPLCFPEDSERCHWCEGTEEHGHSEECTWLVAVRKLNAFREVIDA